MCCIVLYSVYLGLCPCRRWDEHVCLYISCFMMNVIYIIRITGRFYLESVGFILVMMDVVSEELAEVSKYCHLLLYCSTQLNDSHTER